MADGRASSPLPAPVRDGSDGTSGISGGDDNAEYGRTVTGAAAPDADADADAADADAADGEAGDTVAEEVVVGDTEAPAAAAVGLDGDPTVAMAAGGAPKSILMIFFATEDVVAVLRGEAMPAAAVPTAAGDVAAAGTTGDTPCGSFARKGDAIGAVGDGDGVGCVAACVAACIAACASGVDDAGDVAIGG